MLSVALALGVTWTGLAFGYYSRYPIGFYITTIAFGAYVLANAAPTVLRRRPTAVTA
jgi:zinc/manganese transport system permease protein